MQISLFDRLKRYLTSLLTDLDANVNQRWGNVQWHAANCQTQNFPRIQPLPPIKEEVSTGLRCNLPRNGRMNNEKIQISEWLKTTRTNRYGTAGRGETKWSEDHGRQLVDGKGFFAFLSSAVCTVGSILGMFPERFWIMTFGGWSRFLTFFESK